MNDDSFGDFMSGPGTADISEGGYQNSQETTNEIQPASTQETKEEKKGYFSMIYYC